MIDSETGEPVSADETVMGYEFEKNRYVTVEKEEIDELKIESSETVDIEKVVPTSAVDWLYWDTPYLVEPDGKTGLDIFATIRDAIKGKKVAGIGRMVLARRERPVLILPCGKGMLLVRLRDPDEVREPREVFDGIADVKLDRKNLSMAEMLIERMEGEFDLSMFEDRYQEKLHDLVEAKVKGQKPVVSEEPARPTNVVNLFDALKASLEKGGPSTRTKADKGSARTRKTESRSAPARRTRTKSRKRA